MNMKITVSFEATSMANLKDQLLEAFGSISAGGGEIAKHTGFDPAVEGPYSGPNEPHNIAKEQFMKGVVEALTPAEINPVITSQQEVMEQTHIDGHRVSNGSVWVPVEGRSNAFTGIPMDRYLAQKAAKEAGGELDSKGVAWDASIHTSTKVKTQSGEWKKRPVRGAVKETVEAAPAQQPVKVYIPPAPTTTQPVEMPFAPVAPTPVEPVIPVTESLAPAVGSAPDMYSFDSFKKGLGLAIVRLVNQKKIDQNDILALAQHFQVNDLFDLGKDAHTASCKILFDHFVNQGLIIGV